MRATGKLLALLACVTVVGIAAGFVWRAHLAGATFDLIVANAQWEAEQCLAQAKCKADAYRALDLTDHAGSTLDDYIKACHAAHLRRILGAP